MEPLFKLSDFGLRHVETEGGNESSVVGNEHKLFRPAHTKGWFSPFDREDNPKLRRIEIRFIPHGQKNTD